MSVAVAALVSVPDEIAEEPTVTVVVPTLDERRFIRDLLDSLDRQDYGNVVQVLVVDGGSTDGTREIVERHGGTVALVDNPGVTAASAMNIGITRARGEVIVRFDAHAQYAADYISRCVQVLGETGAVNVGGPMRPVGTNAFGRAVATVTTSPIGVGPGRFHYSEDREEVDTVFLGCWRREDLQRVGGFDQDAIQWAAEDHELNLRLRQRGGRIVLDPTIRSTYFPRDTPRGLAQQYFNYGMGKASTLKKHRRLPSLRPLAPAALVALAAANLVAARGPARFTVVAAHTAAVGAASLHLGRARDTAPHRVAAVVGICHWSYGFGFWNGMFRALRGRPFDSRRKV